MSTDYVCTIQIYSHFASPRRSLQCSFDGRLQRVRATEEAEQIFCFVSCVHCWKSCCAWGERVSFPNQWISHYYNFFYLTSSLLCLCHLIIIIKGPSLSSWWTHSSSLSCSDFHVSKSRVETSLARKAEQCARGLPSNNALSVWTTKRLTIEVLCTLAKHTRLLFDERKFSIMIRFVPCEMLTLWDDELFTFLSFLQSVDHHHNQVWTFYHLDVIKF